MREGESSETGGDEYMRETEECTSCTEHAENPKLSRELTPYSHV